VAGGLLVFRIPTPSSRRQKAPTPRGCVLDTHSPLSLASRSASSAAGRHPPRGRPLSSSCRGPPPLLGVAARCATTTITTTSRWTLPAARAVLGRSGISEKPRNSGEGPDLARGASKVHGACAKPRPPPPDLSLSVRRERLRAVDPSTEQQRRRAAALAQSAPPQPQRRRRQTPPPPDAAVAPAAAATSRTGSGSFSGSSLPGTDDEDDDDREALARLRASRLRDLRLAAARQDVERHRGGADGQGGGAVAAAADEHAWAPRDVTESALLDALARRPPGTTVALVLPGAGWAGRGSGAVGSRGEDVGEAEAGGSGGGRRHACDAACAAACGALRAMAQSHGDDGGVVALRVHLPAGSSAGARLNLPGWAEAEAAQGLPPPVLLVGDGGGGGGAPGRGGGGGGGGGAPRRRAAELGSVSTATRWMAAESARLRKSSGVAGGGSGSSSRAGHPFDGAANSDDDDDGHGGVGRCPCGRAGPHVHVGTRGEGLAGMAAALNI